MTVHFGEKFRFAGVHLLVTGVVLAIATVGITQIWYPGDFFRLEDGWSALKYVYLVDLVVGPCLAFVVYSSRKSKKVLLLNMIIIVGVQALALGAGLYTFHVSKPGVVVFHKNTFYVISSSEIDYEKLPDLVGEEVAVNGIGEFMSNSPNGTLDFEAYQLLRENGDVLIGGGRSPSDFIGNNAAFQRAYDDYLLANSLDEKEVVFFPVVGRGGTFMMGLSATSLATVGVLFIEPRY